MPLHYILENAKTSGNLLTKRDAAAQHKHKERRQYDKRCFDVSQSYTRHTYVALYHGGVRVLARPWLYLVLNGKKRGVRVTCTALSDVSTGAWLCDALQPPRSRCTRPKD